jgi:MFS family permease
VSDAAANLPAQIDESISHDDRGRSRTDRTEQAVLAFPTALVAVMLTYWTVDIISPTLPAIKADLGLTAAGTGLVFSMMFVGRLLGNFPAAFLLDRTGAALTGAIGGLLLASGSLLGAIAGGPGILFPARVLQGIGIAFLVNAGLRSIIRAKPAQGAAMTFFSLAATTGGVLGLQSGGFLTESQGWRSVFVLSALLALVGTVASLSGRLFARQGRRPPSPSIPSPLAELATWRGLAVAVTLNFLVFASYSVWVALPLYTESEFGASAETNANLLFVITIMHLIAAYPVGRFIRRWGSPQILIGGLVLALIGTLAVGGVPGLIWLPLPLAVYGAGMVAASSAGGDIVLQRGGGSSKAVGALRLSSDLGLVVGPFVAGLLADAFGLVAPFFFFPIAMVGAVGAAVMLRRGSNPMSIG